LQPQALPQTTLGVAAPFEQLAVHASAPHVMVAAVQELDPLQATLQTPVLEQWICAVEQVVLPVVPPHSTVHW
jgi:hypothetical protein